MTNPTERDNFEAWAYTKSWRNFTRSEDGSYCNVQLNALHHGYKAGRASMASPQLTEACRHRATRINALEALERIRDIAEGELSTKPATVEPVSMAAPVVVWEYLQSLSVQLDAALNLTTGNDAHLRVTVSDVADQLAALALTTPQQPADKLETEFIRAWKGPTQPALHAKQKGGA